jgi:peptide/nickel transport system substrate-binding protein
MQDGTDAHVDIEKINDKQFALHFPRIVSEPILATNMDFGPKHIYGKAKEAGGVNAVLDLFSVSADPKTIPSVGEWFLVEYVPAQRLVFKRNPDYWNRDKNDTSVNYVEERNIQIIPNENTQLLLFKEGKTEDYSMRPEDLDELINKKDADYTVFNNEGSLGAAYWTFNQNPVQKDQRKYSWFTQKEFRQAMSCLLNRDRIIAQVYRGLAEAKTDFFPEPNPYYNEDITLSYLYNPARAEKLFASIGIKRDKDGTMRDSKNRAIEFDLTISSDVTTTADTASIIMDDCAKLGIKLNIRPTDFQKIVEQLTAAYDWHAVMIGLGANLFPSQGSNVWPSDGNLHLWHPLQEEPATDWEARVDYLYNEGKVTIDREKAKVIWDEYQTLLLEQCPVIYLLRPRSFWALRNRWDFTNVYYDNLNGAETSFIHLKQ